MACVLRICLLGILALGCRNHSGNDMPSKKQTFIVSDFSAGVWDFPVYSKAPINSLRKAKNCILARSGSIRRRNGLSRKSDFNTRLTTSSELSDTVFVSSGGFHENQGYLVHDGTTVQVEALSGTTWTASDLAQSHTVGGLVQPAWVRESDGTEWLYVGAAQEGTGKDAQKYPIGLDPTVANGAATIDGTTTTNIPEGAKLLVGFMDRLWAAGFDGASRDKVYYSDILTPETWDQSGQVILVGEIGEAIISLIPYKSNILLIGTINHLYALAVGQSANLLDWELRLISDDVGVSLFRSFAHAREDVFVCDQYDDLRTVRLSATDSFGSVQGIPISEPIRDTFRDLRVKILSFWKGLLFAYEGDLTPIGGNSDYDEHWVYDTALNAWMGPQVFREKGSNAGQVRGAVAQDGLVGSNAGPTGVTVRYFMAMESEESSASATRSLAVFEWLEGASTPTYNDDDSITIPVDIQTQYYDFGFPQQDKTVSWVEVEYGDEDTAFSGTGAWVMSFRSTFDGSWRQVHTQTYDATVKSEVVRVPIPEDHRGRVFQFRFEDSDQTDGPKIRRMWIRFEAHEVDD